MDYLLNSAFYSRVVSVWKNLMKVLNHLPRHAFIVFFWCAIFTAVVCLGSIAAFVILMPDNEHGRRGIATALRAFSPGFLASALTAAASYRVLRASRKARAQP